jgi:hypothetical protein
MNAAHQLGRSVGRAAACRALNVPRASLYRHFRAPAEPAAPPPPRPLHRAPSPCPSDNLLHSERFRDQAPAEIFATLLDEGTYLCSSSPRPIPDPSAVTVPMPSQCIATYFGCLAMILSLILSYTLSGSIFFCTSSFLAR